MTDDKQITSVEREFRTKDYELKVRYLTDHFQRMWTRFNFFVTIESALIGGKFIIGDGKLGKEGAVCGAVLSAVWYVFGAEDRYLVLIYRGQVKEAAEKIAALVWHDEASVAAAYRHVGEIEETSKTERMDISGWRCKWFSTTKLASLFPFFLTLIWLAGLCSLK